MIKTREIKTILTNRGYELGTLHVLEALSEEIKQNARDLKELAHMFDKMVDSMDGMMAVAGRMKETIEKFGKEPDEEDLGPSTQGIGRD